MKKTIKFPLSQAKSGINTLSLLVLLAVLAGFIPSLPLRSQTAVNLNDLSPNLAADLDIFQNNTLSPASSLPEPKIAKKMLVIVTAYSSTVWETDETPNITASGTRTRDGVIANNSLAFGTMVRIPEIYGDKIFLVEDRMNARKNDNHFDVWFPSRVQAKNFGAKTTRIEVLKR